MVNIHLRNPTMIKTLPLAEAKKNLSAIINDIDTQYDRFVVTRNGVDKAVILSSEEYGGLLETLDILSSKEEREAIAKAKEEVRKKDTVSLETFKSGIGLA